MTSSKVYIPDESAIRYGIVSRLINENKIKGQVLIHRAIIAEFEKQASTGDFTGINSLKELRETASKNMVGLEIVGSTAENGDIKSVLRELAFKTNGCIITCDIIAAKMSEALGIPAIYETPQETLTLEEFFKEDVISVHLKEGLPPRVKRGSPGKWVFEVVNEKPLTRENLERLAFNIIRRAQLSLDGESFVEIKRAGSVIIQLKDCRVVITRPPFSDGLEITAVKPIVKLRIQDYGLPQKLVFRLEKQAEGILIAGAPGMGKTTFAQALAEFYREQGKVVKTIESPRDLQLPPDITQYSKNVAMPGEIHDVLLLSRPDYTIFDEMRNTEDFKAYIDLRLAGVGMVGVIHATSPIDAIQRFMNRVELGMIPSIIDTVIFMDKGTVAKVYSLETTVKIPHGLREADLARPVVIVKDFLMDTPEYELYVFGERTFVVPIKKEIPYHRLKAKEVLERFAEKRLKVFNIKVDDSNKLTLLVPEAEVSMFSKKYKKKLEKISRKYNVIINVESLP